MSAAQSGRQRLLTVTPHTTHRAGLQSAVHAHLNDRYREIWMTALGLKEPVKGLTQFSISIGHAHLSPRGVFALSHYPRLLWWQRIKRYVFLRAQRIQGRAAHGQQIGGDGLVGGG